LNRGCSIFSQILQLISRTGFESGVRKHRAERHARGFSSWGTILSQRHPEIFLDTHDFLGAEFSSLHSKCCRFLAELGYRIELTGSPRPEYERDVHAWTE